MRAEERAASARKAARARWAKGPHDIRSLQRGQPSTSYRTGLSNFQHVRRDDVIGTRGYRTEMEAKFV